MPEIRETGKAGDSMNWKLRHQIYCHSSEAGSPHGGIDRGPRSMVSMKKESFLPPPHQASLRLHMESLCLHNAFPLCSNIHLSLGYWPHWIRLQHKDLIVSWAGRI